MRRAAMAHGMQAPPPMATSEGSIDFVVRGERIGTTRGATPGGADLARSMVGGTVKDVVRVGARRGAGDAVRLSATPGEDVVVLQVADGPTLVLHPENARDLLLAQSGATRSAREQARDVVVPAELRWQGLESVGETRGVTRGFLGDVFASAIQIVTGLFKDRAADTVASVVAESVDAQVDPGVYQLRPDALVALKGTDARRQSLAAPSDGGPLLVLVHGTFVETTSTFGRLWSHHPALVSALFERYRQQVFALDHPTLGRSPIDNALTLAQALPKDARLHLVTHSRGGLVAEVLARVAANPERALDGFAGPEAQRTSLRALATALGERAVRVERVVRVACPARGTLLASKRLDAYLSIFKWTLDLAGVPVAPQLLDFLGAVALRRTDESLLPGLAAQVPDSPLVQWLHAGEEPLPGELRVIAGDIEGDSVTSWVKTLMADAFYWTDNDLVVQTRSMYGGAPRSAGASYLLDQGGGVTHFDYFKNERTAGAIVDALVQDAPSQFRPIGPLSWAGESATGVRAARGPATIAAESSRPAVVLLPGILGSHIRVNGKRIWLSLRVVNGLARLSYPDPQDRRVEPDGLIDKSYDDLAEYLERSHQVIEFSFDWRRPIEDEARRLAAAVEAALAARATSGRPVRLLAHSMGGLVARAMQLEAAPVWDRMMSQPGARFLMLGTPNGGSWAPMQVLSGDDTFGNLIAIAGAPFREDQARQVMAGFPGFLQLQAGLLDPRLALGDAATWQRLADDDLARVREHSVWHWITRQESAYRWGVPPADVLAQAVALRRRFDEQREKELARFRDRMLLVVGHAKRTPEGYEVGSDGFEYLDAVDTGDGRVTLANAMLPGVRTWKLDCEHGSLPERDDAFAAYVELLESGSTTSTLLTPVPEAGALRGAAAEVAPPVRSRPSRSRTRPRPPQSTADVQRLDEAEPFTAASTAEPALQVSVVNDDLQFVSQPLMIGHYRSLRLTGTEAVMNRLIGNTMRHSLELDRYPNDPGAVQLFTNRGVNRDNPLQLPRPEAVIVVGLGDEGKLKTQELTRVVRLGVLAWAQHVVEHSREGLAHFDLTATLIGSGGSGMTVASSAQAIAQGVRSANGHIAELNARLPDHPEQRWPLVGHLSLVELYLDRAGEAWRALRVQAQSTPGFRVTPTITIGNGALRRPIDGGYRGADYDLVTVVTGNGGGSLLYTLDTKRARSEVRAQQTQVSLVRELVARASNDRNGDPQIGRTLFRLLVPIDIEPFLSGTSEMLLELDRGTAGIPWEMLDSDPDGGRAEELPWGIRSKVLRKLRTADYRVRVVDASADAHVLVIGEPLCTDPAYPRLPGARREARAIVKRLSAADALGPEQVHDLISEDEPGVGFDARQIINAVMSRDWRVVHISGHGMPAKESPDGTIDPRGVVLSNRTYLGPNEIRGMRVVPELVFINCCYIAARDPGQVLDGKLSFDRPQFAANVAEALIGIGVRCVVATGWAVEDGPAETFATAFYDALLQGRRFIDAVGQARRAAYRPGSNTWAAYQCYGDPDWTLRRGTQDAQHPPVSPGERYAGVASWPALAQALNTIAIRTRRPEDRESARDDLRHLEARFKGQWGDQGSVATAFAAAWDAVGDRDEAIAWYERALAANDGLAALRAGEQLGNLRARAAWQPVEPRLAQVRELEQRVDQAKADRKRIPALAAELRTARSALRTAANGARDAIGDAIGLLEKVNALRSTLERESLLGSAFKRLAMIEYATGRAAQERAALARMEQHYGAAAKIGRDDELPNAFYPLLNQLAAQLLMGAGSPGWKGLDARLVAAARSSLDAVVRSEPDFWSVADETNLSLYEAVAAGKLSDALPSIRKGYEDLYARIASPAKWSSVYDQAWFVLTKYEARISSKAEKDAVRTVLSLLAKFVEVKRSK